MVFQQLELPSLIMANLTRHQYHSTTPEWRSGHTITGKKIGVELEVEGEDVYYPELIRLLPDEFVSGEHCVIETDASLNTDLGMEIVFPPVDYSRIRAGECDVSKTMDRLRGFIREDYAGGRAGMHMNINTNGWSAVKKSYVLAVINTMDVAYLQGIGGRLLTNYCRQIRLTSIADYQRRPNDHSCAAGCRSNRIEVRFPRSTGNKERLQALTVFVDLLEEFAEEMDTGEYEAPTLEEVGPLFISYLEALDHEDSRLVLDWMRNGQDR